MLIPSFDDILSGGLEALINNSMDPWIKVIGKLIVALLVKEFPTS
jgi:hypothetical protein